MPEGRTPKVFIPNKGAHNYEGATQFGELVFVTKGSVNRFDTSFFYRAFVDAMKQSAPEDYFLITSMSVLNAIGCSILARKHGKINLLLFQDGKYFLREVNIDALLEIEDLERSLPPTM